MSVLSDPTAVIEETPPTEIRLDDGHVDGVIGKGKITSEHADVDAVHAITEAIEDDIDLRVEAPDLPSAAPIPSATPISTFVRPL